MCTRKQNVGKIFGGMFEKPLNEATLLANKTWYLDNRQQAMFARFIGNITVNLKSTTCIRLWVRVHYTYVFRKKWTVFAYPIYNLTDQ